MTGSVASSTVRLYILWSRGICWRKIFVRSSGRLVVIFVRCGALCGLERGEHDFKPKGGFEGQLCLSGVARSPKAVPRPSPGHLRSLTPAILSISTGWQLFLVAVVLVLVVLGDSGK